jgi:hypothetical protein
MNPKPTCNHPPMQVTDNTNAISKSIDTLHRAFENVFNDERMWKLFHIAANENRSLDEVAMFLGTSPDLLKVLVSSEEGKCFLHCAQEEFRKRGIPEIFVIPDDFALNRPAP